MNRLLLCLVCLVPSVAYADVALWPGNRLSCSECLDQCYDCCSRKEVESRFCHRNCSNRSCDYEKLCVADLKKHPNKCPSGINAPNELPPIDENHLPEPELKDSDVVNPQVPVPVPELNAPEPVPAPSAVQKSADSVPSPAVEPQSADVQAAPVAEDKPPVAAKSKSCSATLSAHKSTWGWLAFVLCLGVFVYFSKRRNSQKS